MLREEQIARAFHLEAKADLTMAELAYENGIYSRCVSMSQQTVEKMLKSALVMVGVYGMKEHEVLGYFEEKYRDIISVDAMENIVGLTKPIEGEWIRSRYPDWTDSTRPVWIPSEQYDSNKAGSALSGAKDVYKLIVDIMKSEFALEL
ncbi:HEPN domain-containing protein [Candidatus Poribacteria bacterium]